MGGAQLDGRAGVCVGIPVEVIEPHGLTARCRGRNGEEEVNMMLIGPQPAGTWVLNFLGSAREVLDAEEARRIDRALDAMAAVMRGDTAVNLDSFFPDLAKSQ